MASNATTTETLREELFGAMKAVREGTLDHSDARLMATLAEKIIETADLELRYATILSKLDKEDQGIAPGPVLLSQRAAGEIE